MLRQACQEDGILGKSILIRIVCGKMQKYVCLHLGAVRIIWQLLRTISYNSVQYLRVISDKQQLRRMYCNNVQLLHKQLMNERSAAALLCRPGNEKQRRKEVSYGFTNYNREF